MRRQSFFRFVACLGIFAAGEEEEGGQEERKRAVTQHSCFGSSGQRSDRGKIQQQKAGRAIYTHSHVMSLRDGPLCVNTRTHTHARTLARSTRTRAVHAHALTFSDVSFALDSHRLFVNRNCHHAEMCPRPFPLLHAHS